MAVRKFFKLLLFSFERLALRVWSFEIHLWVLKVEDEGHRTHKGL